MQHCIQRVDSLDKEVKRLAEFEPYKEVVGLLRCFHSRFSKIYLGQECLCTYPEVKNQPEDYKILHSSNLWFFAFFKCSQYGKINAHNGIVSLVKNIYS